MKGLKARSRWPVLALTYMLAGACFAATTQTWEMSGYQDFLHGQLNGLSLTREGRLVLGPQVTTLFDSGQSEIWSVAQAPDGSLYLGTGNRGRLFRVDPSGKSALVWTADQPEIFAVAVDSKGTVYAGTSPDGKVYRIQNGKAAEYFSPRARYIWDLAVAPDGALIVGTGDEGKIFRVTGSGQGSVLYETGQAHVTALAFDTQGRLLAGTEPNGILYRITDTAPGKSKGFVLYDANLPEIRSIVAEPDGTIYASALGGGVAKRVGAATAATSIAGTTGAPVVSTSVTVTDQQGGITPAPKPEAPKPSATPQATVVTATESADYSGGDRSALYKISPDNTVETLWSSKEENIYDLALQGSSILFLTDAQGRIYRLDGGGKTTLVTQANEGDVTRLMLSRAGMIAATGNLGKLLRLNSSSASTGWFESPVHDAGAVARWGRIHWHGQGQGVAFRTRTGNSARPDATWSDWSSAIMNPSQAAISSPNARYIQWRAEFSANAGAPPALDDVSIAYLPQNTPPVVRSIIVSGMSGLKTATSTPSSGAAASYSITVSDTGDTSSPAGTSSQTISRGAGQQIQITWQADDPDGDHLIYNLYFRGDDESEWKLLRGNMTENTFVLDGDVLADGRYFFRVTASDRPSNPASFAREAELISSPVLIDNTPPVVTPGVPRRVGSTLEIEVDAEDRGSVLRRCEYSVDAGPWSPVEAVDGVTDSAREHFSIRLEGFPTGEHLISIRVFDATGNAGLAKVVVR